MQDRKKLSAADSESYSSLLKLEQTLVKNNRANHLLFELVRVQISQLNLCHSCAKTHGAKVIAAGGEESMLAALPTWSTSPLFSKQQKAALALAQEMTQLSAEGVTQPTYESALQQLGEPVLGELIIVIATINAWNRITIATTLPYSS